jgi:hypothetical protein
LGETPLQVFIQYADPADRGPAAQLQGALQAGGYKAPGIERVASAPRTYQVRYYKQEQAGQARDLATTVQKTLGLSQPPDAVWIGQKYPGLPAGVMEVWFPQADASNAPMATP